MQTKNITTVFLILSVLSVGSAAAFGQNVNTRPIVRTLPIMCEYAAPSEGCRYVEGPNYDSANGCGMVLQCSSAGGPKLVPLPPVVVPPYGGSGSGGSANAAMQVTASRSGECPLEYMMSVDKKTCLKIDAYTTFSSSASSSAAIPTMFISPVARSTASVTFSSDVVRVRATGSVEATNIAPAEGFRVVVSAPAPVTVEKGASGAISISRNDISASVTAHGDVEVGNGTVTVSGKTITVMPDVAVSAAVEGGVGANVRDVTLHGSAATGVLYSVTGIKKSRILGIFPVQMSIVANVNAQTAAVESVQRPWWSFVAW